MNDFGKKITEARLDKGWTIQVATEELEKLAGRSRSEAYLLQVERGYKLPSTEVLVMLAVLYSLDPDELFEGIIKRLVDEFEQKHRGKYRLALLTYNEKMEELEKETQK